MFVSNEESKKAANPNLPHEEPATPAVSTATDDARAVVKDAKLIGGLTLVSRVLGMARESVASFFFGAGAIWSAFTVAFTIPNLFRKLFGEGALSAAFIPLYAQEIRHRHPEQAKEFAVASVNLLCAILIGLTIIGEGILWGMMLIWDMRPDRLLTVKLTMIMLPYVLLVCGTAFLGAILQVHRRFGATAATPIILNLFLIIAIVLGSRLWNFQTDYGQTMGVLWLAVTVLVAGMAQVLVLAPSLRAVGFRFRPILHFWTPAVQRMLKLTVPVALGAGVLQISVMLDKGISLLLASGVDQFGNQVTHFDFLGWSVRYPLAEGAAARLNWAQFMYQFPLGVFAIALATAIFPKLASGAHGQTQIQRRDAEDAEGAQRRKPNGNDEGAESRVRGSGFRVQQEEVDEKTFEGHSNQQSAIGNSQSEGPSEIDYSQRPDAAKVTGEFKTVLRRGLEACMFIGLPASVGLIVVCEPATRLLFQHGAFTESDAKWVALSTALYSSAIWAFSLQQILSRAYYALHDTITPLVASIVTLMVNLMVELPLLWTRLGEAGMAAGTAISFAVQALIMLNLLRRKVGTLGLSQSVRPVGKMVIAAGLMWLACWGVGSTSLYELSSIATNKLRWAIQLVMLMSVGGAVYMGACMAMGIDVMTHVRRKKK